MLTSLRKNSTLVIVTPDAVEEALATKFTVERLCRLPAWPTPTPTVGCVIVTVGGVPTSVATLTFTGGEVAVREFVSVTRAVNTCWPSWAVVGVQENV